MIYITVMQHRKPKQITWEDVINDNVALNDFANDASFSSATITRVFEEIPAEIKDKINVEGMIRWLEKFNESNQKLFEADRNSLYYSFKIPKATGGFRQIDAPNDDLQNELRRLANFLSEECGVLYHTSAFAYVKGRSIVDCLKKHQKNNSEWYLKTDFSGFFPNTTLPFTMKMLSMIFPLSEVCKSDRGFSALEKAISLGFKDKGLPQGTCLSPVLTNIISIPVDHELFNTFAHRNIVYTRYADDMHISAKDKFPKEMAIKTIENALKKFNAPWVLKEEKTHYGNRHGKNWCLGLVVNAENNITVGWKAKSYFKSALCSFILDTKNGKYWDIGDVMHLRGQLAYYTMVEPEYFNKIISQQNKKWHDNVKELFKQYGLS